MMKDQELVWFKRKCSVRVAAVVRELNLVDTVEEFHDGTDLAPHEAVRRNIYEESDHVQGVR